jgi:hypothetical protein
MLVSFYCLWHGKYRLPGSGWILRQAARCPGNLTRYRLSLAEKQTIDIDFTDVSSVIWLNHLLGDRTEEDGLVKAIEQSTPQDGVLWDIGANCGVFSYQVAKQGRARKIIFLSPIPCSTSWPLRPCNPSSTSAEWSALFPTN